jgi:diguanylate cyclase (GGDEF)-like protein/PAS domain S-box-containing protein
METPSYHGLLLRQLKRLGIDAHGPTPTGEQWARFLDRVSRAYTEADQERYLLERSQEISSREMQQLYRRLEESQRIAGLGNWSWDRTENYSLWSEECSRIFGFETGMPAPSYRQILERVHQRDRAVLQDAVRAALHAGQPFAIEFRVQPPSGGQRWVSTLGKPVKDPDGATLGLHGTFLDVTRRKQTELKQTVEHAVTRLLAEAESPLAAMPRIVRTIGETLSWACGAFWLRDSRQNTFQRVTHWSAPEDARAQAFYRSSSDSARPSGCAGLIARTANTGVPVWVSDVTRDEAFATRKAAATDAGLHAALAFPIQQAGGDVVGVLEFFSHEAQGADEEMLRSAQILGRQIAQFFQRQQAEDALRESEAHFRALVEQASDSLYVHDVEGRFIDVNQRGYESLGYTRAELLRLTVADIDTEFDAAQFGALRAQMALAGPVARESRYRRKDGTTFPVEIRLGPIEIGGHQHLLCLARDVTERQEMQDHIRHLAFHDSLTGLPNRAKFNGYLSHAVVQAGRYQKKLAVLFIDLDRFKNINDVLGHDAGDRLLQEMAHRLSACLRGGDLVARLGGDEFVVLIEEVADPAYVSHVARKILSAVEREYTLHGRALHVTASIGISTYPEDGAHELVLMKNADIAMYRAKERGKNNYMFYSAQMNQHSFELLALESGLRRALEHDEFVLYYQPKVDARSGRIKGVEALVRWRHPDLGLVLPELFIPVAEETGLIVPLGNWVLRRACEQQRLWRAQGLPVPRVALNLSARQFADDKLLTDIARALRHTQMEASALDFEITESMVMGNTDKTVQILASLRAMGARIAIDDFGMGYSSLSHLKQFPIDILKIDRSFVRDIPGNPVDEAIARAVIALGKNLGITTVAEGVENARQWQFLRDCECDEIQGYYFHEPLTAEALAQALAEPASVAAEERSSDRRR